jgi:PncC family amidohydrolase
MKEVVQTLIKLGKTISTMESCTGGALASSITDIEGASEVLKFSAVTYSNEFKIKMGVDENIINQYSVYSIETANQMSKNISLFTNSDYGVGITGKLNRIDVNNLFGNDNTVFISNYDKEKDEDYEYSVDVSKATRRENKDLVIDYIEGKILEVLNYGKEFIYRKSNK